MGYSAWKPSSELVFMGIPVSNTYHFCEKLDKNHTEPLGIDPFSNLQSSDSLGTLAILAIHLPQMLVLILGLMFEFDHRQQR